MSKADCTAAGPKTTASRTPGHGSGGPGAANRADPTGGRAYGTPRKTTRGPSEEPVSRPDAVSTIGVTARGPYRPCLARGRTRYSPPARQCLPGGGSEGTTRAGGLHQSHSPLVSSARWGADLSAAALFLVRFRHDDQVGISPFCTECVLEGVVSLMRVFGSVVRFTMGG